MREGPERRRDPRTTESQAIVDAICEATALLLHRDGPDALNTNAIARVAGVGIGSVYEYFPNKQAIVVEVARRLEERALEAAMARAGQIDPGDPRSVCASLVGVLLDPRLGSVTTRRALLVDVPLAWVLPAATPTDATVERLLGSVMETLSLRDGPRDVMSFVVFHAVEGAVEGALLRAPERLFESAFREEVFALAWRYAAPDGARLEAPSMDPTAPWPEASEATLARLAALPRSEGADVAKRVEPSTARGRASFEAIVGATSAILGEGGWDAVSARAIARRAAVSPASVYRYFPDLRAIAGELARRREAQTLAAVAPILADRRRRPLPELFADLLGALVGAASSDRLLRRALLLEVPRRWIRGISDEVAGAVAELGVKQIEVQGDAVRPAPPALLLEVLEGALSHCVESAVVHRPELLDDPRFVEELVQLAVRYLRS
ncbi:MAG: TetR/AcrR family transcriptional regulator [Sandaracinaceae bacterium]|nr:TetR/AcrR family transcriptional regulator [Sandaracinaceae bacterium]